MIKHKPLLRFQMVQLQPRALWMKIDAKKIKSGFILIIQKNDKGGHALMKVITDQIFPPAYSEYCQLNQ